MEGEFYGRVCALADLPAPQPRRAPGRLAPPTARREKGRGKWQITKEVPSLNFETASFHTSREQRRGRRPPVLVGPVGDPRASAGFELRHFASVIHPSHFPMNHESHHTALLLPRRRFRAGEATAFGQTAAQPITTSATPAPSASLQRLAAPAGRRVEPLEFRDRGPFSLGGQILRGGARRRSRCRGLSRQQSGELGTPTNSTASV